MSLWCACGNRVATNEAPSKRHGAFATEADFERALDVGLQGVFDLQDRESESREERLNSSMFDAYIEIARDVVFCDVCGRMYLQDAPGSASYAAYLPEPMILDDSD